MKLTRTRPALTLSPRRAISPAPAIAAALAVLALAGCTAPAPEVVASNDVAAREESRDRVLALVSALAGPQDDAFGYARLASDQAVEGVDLIGIESYDALSEGGEFGALSFRTPVDAAAFPDVADLPEAYCFRAPFAAAGAVVDDADGGGVSVIDCPADAETITPPAP
ncbi:hypothetical protein GTU73_00070 [Rathayibacter sp. VKM Ac-2804]|uniref:hypothetical protein n=1 Tax=unclassified Rathayibacter TaxID=2609250 RepID=UPI00132E9B23|nr:MULTISPECIES: hypothetical protein [unclassified Rathayibacter]NRG42039.1 hypothetical protein [Rathayibacter sp. VKM Ac-2835]QHF22554.1 hypothetical protein GTU73_00070 [Rathayibacter sp. VKM Ac-2804]